MLGLETGNWNAAAEKWLNKFQSVAWDGALYPSTELRGPGEGPRPILGPSC